MSRQSTTMCCGKLQAYVGIWKGRWVAVAPCRCLHLYWPLSTAVDLLSPRQAVVLLELCI